VVKADAQCITGFQAWPEATPQTWRLWPATRQVDVVLGMDVAFAAGVGEGIVPCLAIELKTGKNLNTDELDKKSAVYSALREVFPWVRTVFLLQSNSERNMGWYTMMRNARRFDLVLSDWSSKKTKEVLRNEIQHHLNYVLNYWDFGPRSA